MDFSTNEEAEALWHDVIDLLSGEGMPSSRVALLEGCVPREFDGDTLTVVASSRFMRLQVERNLPLVEDALSRIAYQSVSLRVEDQAPGAAPIRTNSEISQAELSSLSSSITGSPAPAPAEPAPPTQERKIPNVLVEDITEADSKLTFERFVEGEENMMALQAAKQVADGINKAYNPLFIHGKSGVGKTHLLKAIQNYIARNEPSRICVYKAAADFINDYTSALQDKTKGVMEELERAYRDIDVLIIDDVQQLKGAASTLRFFFNTFNYLIDHGKQIVIAADESPMQLGMGEKGFDERLTSRFDSGFTCPIQVPDFELKRALVRTFYTQMKEDAANENLSGYEGSISDENLNLMAERSGTNIRVIRSFCQSCLLEATKCEERGGSLQREDILRISSRKFASAQRLISVEQIQRAVEGEYQVSHNDLVGSKRTKEIMEPRHIAIWLTRELTDNTLEAIGKRFGGRSHATVKHSIQWVEDSMRENRVFFDRTTRLKDDLLEE